MYIALIVTLVIDPLQSSFHINNSEFTFFMRLHHPDLCTLDVEECMLERQQRHLETSKRSLPKVNVLPRPNIKVSCTASHEYCKESGGRIRRYFVVIPQAHFYLIMPNVLLSLTYVHAHSQLPPQWNGGVEGAHADDQKPSPSHNHSLFPQAGTLSTCSWHRVLICQHWVV